METFKTYCYVFVFCFCIPFVSTSQGHYVKQYTTEDGLPQNNITSLKCDQSNNVWIGTNGGLSVFDGRSFYNYFPNIVYPRIYRIYEDSLDQINVLTEGNQHYTYKSNSNRLLQLDLKNEQTINPQNIDRYIFPEYYRSRAEMDDRDFKFLSNRRPFAFYLDSLCIRAENDTLLVSLSSTNHQYTFISLLPKGFKSDALIFYSNDTVFFLQNNTIYKIVIQENRISGEVMLNDIPLDKNKDRLSFGTYNTKSNTFYFGSYLNGLFEIKPKYFKVLKHLGNDKSSAISYYSQTEYEPGKIKVNNNLELSLDGNHEYFNPLGIQDRALNYMDNHNNLWLSNDRFITITNNEIQNTLTIPEKLISPLSNICVINDSLSYLSNERKLFVLKNKKELSLITRDELGLDKAEEYRYLYKEGNNSFMYILTNKAMYQYDLQTKINTKIDSYAKANYRIMKPLNEDLVFIGTYGQGYLIKYKGQIFNMPLDNNQYLKYAHTGLCDANGHVWISSNHGLFRTRIEDIMNYVQGNTENIYYYYYDKTTGFLTNEFNGGCQSPAIALSNGWFSFSSIDGLVQFDPLEVPALFPDEDIHIFKLWLDGKPMDTIPIQLEISQDLYQVKLEISTAYYGHPSNYSIEYSIQGLTDGWHSLEGNKYITIQNATHGDYDMVIRRRNGFGADDFDYLSYPIQIKPYYYQTLWFKFIIGIIVLGLIMGTFKWYQRYNIEQNKRLESIIKQRTKELNLTNHNLKDQIKQNELFQSIFVHDIKSPIRFITSNSELLHHHWHELDDDLKLTNLGHIHDASANIGNFIEETLLWMKIQKGELEIKREEFKVLPLLQRIVDLYKSNPKIINGDVKLLIRCTHELSYISDRHLLTTVLRNLLANSIKYTKKGSIELFAIKSIDGKLSMGCSDTGVGMSQHLIDQLLSKEYQGNDIREDSYKMGFIIIKDITKILNGLLTISSEVNSGTKVSVEFGDTITNK